MPGGLNYHALVAHIPPKWRRQWVVYVRDVGFRTFGSRPCACMDLPEFSTYTHFAKMQTGPDPVREMSTAIVPAFLDCPDPFDALNIIAAPEPASAAQETT